ncbi:hypothetical protein KP509_19G065400 [Ceratopteris richardii]|uniref:RING-type domain-containing protein n=1 Tax=Ceratopteris richardii TaxID=49495 RepID=A0A8T2SN22_CERRI|nr:hypothetical protein KP509_19G065400 [Ceratopteris richardii]KAH7352809.1 hypothetical protein KP509_19G065400 [Ceratopteris richardii]KAH7352812.1 hypothetical protein KP509_19G065400 [Ceratopteris richardii]
MAASKSEISQGQLSCSVCLEVVTDASHRSIARLTCGHQFHLDCIGSAFNAKGSMQCPNCRHVENGRWLYGSGGHRCDDPFLEDIIIEEEYDLFPGPELLPHEYLFGHAQWRPFERSYAQLSLLLGDSNHQQYVMIDNNHQLLDHADLVVNVLVGENLGSNESSQPFPLVLAPIVMHASGAGENVRGQERTANTHRGVNNQRRVSPRMQPGYQSPTTSAPIAGAMGGPRPSERSRRHRENHSVDVLSQARYHGQQSFTPSQMVDNYGGSQFAPAWNGAAQSVVQNASRESEPRTNVTYAPRRQEGPSVFRQYPSERAPSAFQQFPSEAEGQRWAPPPLTGLYGTHVQIPNSAVSGDLHAFQPYHYLEDIDPQLRPNVPPR